jgi:transcriptional regulator with AAA-type ATPase domain
MDVLAELAGESPKMVELRRRVQNLLQRQAGTRQLPPILIQGETGAGKRLLARLIHRAGPRAHRPFIDINCAAIPETLLEAELFGYERGAFTDARQAKPGLFQAADGGTLFLDEIALLPQALQAKLLKVLEEGVVRRLGATRPETVSVSILAATNEDLTAAVRQGRFREDLYHRLAVLTFEVPPLRERGADVEQLADRFLAQACAEYGLPVKALGSDARAALRAHRWPGNVRELSNVLERAALLSDSRRITAAMLGLSSGVGSRHDTPPGPAPADSWERLSDRERLEEALRRTGWNISRAAAALGITRNTIRARIERYGLQAAPGGPRGKPLSRREPPRSPDRVTGSVSAEPGAWSASAAGVRWERRRITLLRASILAGDAEPTLATTRLLEDLIVKIHTFGGRVEEVSPTGVVAAFGFEPAENAPWRAANAAISMLKAIDREHAASRLRPTIDVALGIHSTQGLVACIGSTAQLDQATKAEAWVALDRVASTSRHDILLSDTAAALLRRHFELRRRGEAVHQLIGRDAGGSGRPATSFVGRGREIELLASRLELAGGGHGQVVSVVGEPGIGKSRVVREFRQRLPEDVVVLEGRCVSYGTHIPYLPVLDILQAIFRIQEFDPLERIDTKVLAALERLGPEAMARAPYVQHLLHPRQGAAVAAATPATIKARTFEALQQLVVAQQEQRLVFILVEDLQWIDTTSDELLASLVELAVGTRVLVVTTFRHGYRPSWSGRSHVSQIALGPLSTEDSRRLVASVLPGDSQEPVVRTILARGEGNPLFLEELACAVGEQGSLSLLQVPDTVHDVLAARIAHLSDVDRLILRCAAVVGRDVPLALLRDACEVPSDELSSGLSRLQSAEFLYPTRLGPEPEYTFKHALTYEVAYDGFLEAERRAVHARVAVAIEKLAPETRERRPEILARHYTEAGRHAEAIGYWQRAGQLAVQRSAHADAVAHLTTGLSLLGGQPPSPERDHQEIMLQLAFGASLAATQGYGAPGLERTLARTRELTERLGESPPLVAARWALWRFYFSRAQFSEADDLAAQLTTAAQRPGAGAGLRSGHRGGRLRVSWLGARGHGRSRSRGGAGRSRPGARASREPPIESSPRAIAGR